jgi:hypothetical protein
LSTKNRAAVPYGRAVKNDAESCASGGIRSPNFCLTPGAPRRKTNRAREGNENFPARGQKELGERFQIEVQ